MQLFLQGGHFGVVGLGVLIGHRLGQGQNRFAHLIEPRGDLGLAFGEFGLLVLQLLLPFGRVHRVADGRVEFDDALGRSGGDGVELADVLLHAGGDGKEGPHRHRHKQHEHTHDDP